ncbi:MAG: hypothetical protein MUF59_02695 [Candidatus Krumholzibacteria bacterium]|nr:hypothetical protein [Candidatus Krumholzibacteria bacterium]
MAKTHAKGVFSLNRKVVDILEYGKDYYTKGSAILMPAKPDDADQKKIPGIKGLAAAYRQFEFDSRKRLVVAGHADSGGDVKKNFELSALRAEGIVCLLAADGERWSAIAEKTQKVEDIKRVLKYFHNNRKNWNCNPPDIDGKWDANNEKDILAAVKKFITGYNIGHAPKLPVALVDGTIKTDKKFTKEVWKAVFELYLEEMCGALGIKPKAGKTVPDTSKIPKTALKFVNEAKKFTACGESFPMTENKFKSNYTTDKYERAELLFFNGKDIDAGTNKIGARVFACPAGEAVKHTSNGPPKCPLWYANHMLANYIDPEKDLNATAYHLAFTYIDKVKVNNKKPTVQKAPAGLVIETYHYKKVGAKWQKLPINSVTKFSDGVYTVQVDNTPARDDLHFEFSTKSESGPDKAKWIYTAAADSAPSIVEKKINEVRALQVPDKYADYFKHYDLPKEWSSQLYWTRYKDGANDKGGRFEAVMKALKIKPYGAKTTQATNPLTFFLDDIVLVDKEGRQNINDSADAAPKDRNAADGLVNLSDNSRYSLFYVLEDKLVLYKPEANYPSLTDFKFKQNLITDLPVDGVVRMIIFANDCYSVSDARTERTAKFQSPKHVLGCRAATAGDARHHFGTKARGMIYNSAQTITLTAGSTTVTGAGTKFLTEVLPGFQLSIYKGTDWSPVRHDIVSIQSDTQLTIAANPAGGETGAGKYFKTLSPPRHSVESCGNFQLHYIHGGCLVPDPAKADNLKVRSFLLIYWNGRYKKSGAGITDAEVATFGREGPKNTKERWEHKGYMIEPKTADAQGKGKVQIMPVFHFETKYPANGGKHGCMVSITNNSSDGEMGVDNSKMYKESYKSPVNPGDHSDYNRGEQTDIDGKKYRELVIAHEYGHATGKYDDYEYSDGSLYDKAENFFLQWYPGMSYQWDFKSMMWYTEAPRMRHLWNFVNRLNEASADDGELKKILNGADYKIVHRFSKGGADKTLNFHLASAPNDYRDITKPHKSGTTAFAAGRVAVAGQPEIPAGQPGGPKAAVAPVPAAQGKGKFDLHLSKLGEDETAWSIQINNAYKNWAFDGILTAVIKVGFKFVNYKKKTGPTTYATNNWAAGTAPDKGVWMSAVSSYIKDKLNGRFYLEGNNADFKRTYLFFFPICLDLDALAKAGKPADYTKAHYTIRVIYNDNEKVPEPATATELEAGNDVSREWIARYLFGQDAAWTGAAAPYHSTDESQPAVNKKVRNIGTGTAVAFQATDMDFIRDWLRTQLGDNSFTLIGTPKP